MVRGARDEAAGGHEGDLAGRETAADVFVVGRHVGQREDACRPSADSANRPPNLPRAK
jgi:hypothetical protein